MPEENEDIKIIGVDKEAIKISSEKGEYWSVPFRLSHVPDQSWHKKFHEVREKDKSLLKRKAQVSEKTINVEVSGADDLQKVLDALKVQIAETNILCAEDYQKKLKIRQELEDLQQKQRDITAKFKDDAVKLKF